MENGPPSAQLRQRGGGSYKGFGSIFMQSIKILPPAEMGPEADPLLREGGNAAHRVEKDGRKLPGWGQWDLAPQGRKQMGQDA